MRPRALDLFAGAGGAGMGLYRAGFDVVGVDRKPQPRYPAFHDAPHAKHFAFHHGDALAYPVEGFDFIWASPPCQPFSALRHMPTARNDHEDLIEPTRARLIASGVPYCIENVEGAPLGNSGYLIMLCGSMFGLQTADGRAELRRHRLFETSFSIPLRPACQHGMGPRVSNGRERPRAITITGSTPQTNLEHNRVRETFTVQQAREAMQIEWMTMEGLSQAIPPVYSEFIARQLLDTGRVAPRSATSSAETEGHSHRPGG